MVATRIPFVKSSLKIDDTLLMIVGPTVQPISPPKASNANSILPPLDILPAAKLNVPGQKIPHENPHKAHAIRAITGLPTNATHK